jgi:hypothetical protein
MTLKYASNASKLHRKVGEVLEATSPFKGCTLQQEVPVSSLFSQYPNNRDRYDWVVPRLNLIIECHGIQHYKFQTFGEDAEIALMKWKQSLLRDERKKQIAIESGWTYIEVPYTDEKEINSAYLLERFHTEFNEEALEDTTESKPEWQQEAHSAQLDRAKKARQERYRFLKKLKEERDNDNSS